MTPTRSLLAVALGAAALPALAHTGHDHAFNLYSGLAHPVGGLDHLLAMVAVGLWAAAHQGKVRLAAPATFVLAMLGGCLLGAGGVALPAVEPGIALSVLVLGLMVAAGSRVPASIGLPLIAAFALVHGHAHGAEAPAGSLAGYMAGFVLATAALHGAGLVAGNTLLARASLWLRAGGAAIAACGAWLLASSL